MPPMMEYDTSAPGYAEEIRKKHINHEASVKSIGTLYFLGGIISLIVAVVYLSLAVTTISGSGRPRNFQPGGQPPVGLLIAVLLVTGIVFGLVSVAQIWIAWGLRGLKPYARIGGIVLSAIGLLGFPVVTIISAYVLYLLISEKGVYIFTPHYQEVIKMTPHIKYKSSIIVKIFLYLLLFFVALTILMVVISFATSRR